MVLSDDSLNFPQGEGSEVREVRETPSYRQDSESKEAGGFFELW